MIFDSTVFLFIFLPISLLIYYLTPGRFKNAVLVLVSILFYAWGEPTYVLLLVVMILWNYKGASLVARNYKRPKRAKRTIYLLVGSDVFFLILFKYAGSILDLFGHELAQNRFLLAPVGISFFMLQSIAYVIDVYRGEIRPQKSIVRYALFISMFPKIVAGPLVSARDFEWQLSNRKLSWEKFSEGMMQFVRGMAKKVILGRAAGEIFTAVFVFSPAETSALSAWIGCGAFAFWMYFTFGGYCDMALGLGKLYGFDLPDNVNHPSAATGIMDFWSRWQATLWKWFCSYVYLPLCGDNPGGVIGFFSLLTTWVLIGLWHGLRVNFIMWGIYFAVLLYLEGFVLSPVLEKFPKIITWFGTSIFVMISWVFFFHDSVGGAFTYLGCMAGIGGHGWADAKGLSLLTNYAVLWMVSVGISFPAARQIYERITAPGKRWQVAVNCMVYAVLFILCIAGIAVQPAGEFFYFRF